MFTAVLMLAVIGTMAAVWVAANGLARDHRPEPLDADLVADEIAGRLSRPAELDLSTAEYRSLPVWEGRPVAGLAL